MTFEQAVRSAMTKFATFSGRARRSEYWWFYLFTFLVSCAASVVDLVLGLAVGQSFDIVGLLAWLALLLPSLAVTVRRLHDTGRTGWWMWLPLPPLLITIGLALAAVLTAVFSASGGEGITGSLATTLVLLAVFGLVTLAVMVWLLVMLCQDSAPGPNRYGPSPKQPWAPPVGPGFYPPVGYGEASPPVG